MRSGGYKCYNIKCGSCMGKTLCGEPADTALGCVNRVVNTPTNADHIRSMTDEELAKFLLEIMSNSVCFGEGMFPYHPCPQEQDCEKCGLGWLKQPYKEAPNDPT